MINRFNDDEALGQNHKADSGCRRETMTIRSQTQLPLSIRERKKRKEICVCFQTLKKKKGGRM